MRAYKRSIQQSELADTLNLASGYSAGAGCLLCKSHSAVHWDYYRW